MKSAAEEATLAGVVRRLRDGLEGWENGEKAAYVEVAELLFGESEYTPENVVNGVMQLLCELDGLREVESERDQLRAALQGVLPTAEAWHRRAFMDKCDHDENCYCDHEARSSAALQAAREVLQPKPEGE